MVGIYILQIGMYRYFITLSFNGSHYHGWQLQPNAPTVQAEIEKALFILTREKIKVTGSGRTDTGVHARNYVAHFDSGLLLSDEKEMVHGMNALLPRDIAIHRVFPVKPGTHARYSALSRTYKYTISRVKDPITTDLTWFYHGSLNIELMNKAADYLLSVSDFTSFSKLHSDTRSNICKIYEISWSEEDNLLIFTIRANRFLRNMVRSIVGTMVDLGRGKISIDDFMHIVNGRNRSLAGFSSPAQGLSLVDVQYPIDIQE